MSRIVIRIIFLLGYLILLTTTQNLSTCVRPSRTAGMLVMPDVFNGAFERSSSIIKECPCDVVTGSGILKFWPSTNGTNPLNAWDLHQISQLVCYRQSNDIVDWYPNCNCTNFCMCAEDGSCYRSLPTPHPLTIVFYSYCDPQDECHIYTDLNTWRNDHIIAEPSGVFIDSPDNTTIFGLYGYVKAIAVGCGGCNTLRQQPCLSNIFGHEETTTREINRSVEPVFEDSYCEKPNQNVAGMVLMNTRDVQEWPKEYIQPTVKNCSCGEGTLRFWNPSNETNPTYVYDNKEMAYYFCYELDGSCQCSDPCMCDIFGECYIPKIDKARVSFDPYCSGAECYVYADPNTKTKGDWINEDTGESISSPEKLMMLGPDSGFPKIVAIGCNGCQALRALPCLASRLGRTRKILDLLNQIPRETLQDGLSKVDAFSQTINYTLEERSCLTDWKLFEPTQKCFMAKFCIRTVYLEANNFCREQGGVLASMHSNEENEFVTNMTLLKNTTLYPTKWIIGLSNINGEWRFDDGSAFDYTNWLRTSPDGLAIEFNVALLTNNNESGVWDDVHSLDGDGFICQHVPKKCENTSSLYVSRSLKTEWYNITQTPIDHFFCRHDRMVMGRVNSYKPLNNINNITFLDLALTVSTNISTG